MICLRNARVIAGVFFLALLSACATPQTTALQSSWPADLPRHAELDQVPFYPQEEHQCGPASLAMALQYAGKNVEPKQLTPLLYVPEKQGSLQAEMTATARRSGAVAYVLRPELQDVLEEVAAGSPVVVLQNLGLSWYPVWHYAVVIGYDAGSEEIILHSGVERRQVIPFFTFENTWARSAHWAMVALPPGRIPQTAAADEYIRSLIALDHTTHAKDLQPVFAAATKRWPENLLVIMAAGNYAYQYGQLDLAHELFLRATQEHPDSVAAFNNLAQTLSDLGQLDAALNAARKAVSMGGDLNAQARDTLTEIENRVAHEEKKSERKTVP